MFYINLLRYKRFNCNASLLSMECLFNCFSRGTRYEVQDEHVLLEHLQQAYYDLKKLDNHENNSDNIDDIVAKLQEFSQNKLAIEHALRESYTFINRKEMDGTDLSPHVNQPTSTQNVLKQSIQYMQQMNAENIEKTKQIQNKEMEVQRYKETELELKRKLENEKTNDHKRMKNLQEEINKLREDVKSKTDENLLLKENLKDSSEDKIKQLSRKPQEDTKETLSQQNRENEIDQLREDIKTAKRENKRLEEEKEKIENTQRENTELIDKLKQQTEYSENKIKELTLKLGKDTKQVLTEELLSSVKTASSDDAPIKALIDQQAVLIDRLAAEMNAKVSSNESSLENISIQNRPMNIAEEYNLLMSNAWLDAKVALDGEDTDEDEDENESEEACKLQMLCDVLLISEKQAKSAYDMVQMKLSEVLGNPIPWATDQPEIEPKSDITEKQKFLPQALVNNLADFLRSAANKVNIDFVLQEIKRELKVACGDQEVLIKGLESEEVNIFIDQSARLAWKMVIQRPPMSFDVGQKGEPWSEDKGLELMWGSDPEAPDAKILCYKVPRLMHGGKQMVKAMVYVR